MRLLLHLIINKKLVLTQIQKVTMIIDEKVRDKNVQYNLNREAAKKY